MDDLLKDRIEAEDHLAFEAYFADGEVEESDDDLIWKDILKEGTWAYRPGPGQKPTPIPLKVVREAKKEGEIGLQDLIDSFEAGAVDHVTVPLSHQDRPEENTGYVKKLRIQERDGVSYLQAGIEFTEPEIKEKVERRSIANVSSGIIFNYIKKDIGKKFKQVLGHVALTNKPWINGMQPFGVNASEEFSGEDVYPIELADVVWDNSKSFNWLRNGVQKALTGNGFNDYYVVDIGQSKALVSTFDGDTENTFVVPFQVRSGEVRIPAQEKWVAASKEWVKMSQELTKDFDNDTSSLSEEAPERGANVSHNGGNKVDKDNEEKREAGAPSDPAPAVELSEEVREALKEELRAEFAEQAEEVVAENQALRKKLHELEVEKKVNEFKSLGLSEHPGVLKEVRNLMLADDGKPALNLSEEVDGEVKTVSLSATEIVDRIINALPKKGDKVLLGEQVLESEDTDRPETELSEDFDKSPVSDRANALAEAVGRKDLVREAVSN